MWHERSGLVCYQFIREGCRLQPPVFRPQPAPCQHGAETLSSYLCLVSTHSQCGCIQCRYTGVLWLSALVICSGYLVICHNDHH